MTRRYFCDVLPAEGGLVSLPADEAGHAIRVMRVKVGDSLSVFDGNGREAHGVVASLSRNECHCQLESPVEIPRMPAVAIHIAVALPKPDRAREMIERLTELGVKRVTPLVAERTQRPPSDSVLKKLKRAVLEACKQSRRNELMTLDDPVSSLAFFDAAAGEEAVCWIAHPAEAVSGWAESGKSHTKLCVAIGPEGGWTDDEVVAAKNAGFLAIDLGERIYRVETAATSVAAVLVHSQR